MSSDAAGMMEGAYFVSRSDIINWLNSFLKVNLKEVQETASGAIACQLMDAIYPNTIPMSKVDFSCKDDYEFIKNYKLLQSCFSKNGITKQIDVERLIRGKYQDNFEFMQWMKWFFDTHYNHNGPEYDAIGRRSHSKGGREITARNVPMKSNTSTTSNNTINRTPRVSNISITNTNTSSANTMNKKSSNVSNTSLNTSTSQYSNTRSSLRGNESISKLNTSMRRVSLATTISHGGSTNHNNDEQFNKRISELEEENKKITQELEQYKELLTQEKNTSTNLIHERDFYYYKLRDVEDTVLGFEENNGSNDLTAQIKQTLYAGSDDNDNNNDNNNMDINTSNDIMQE